MSSPAKTAALQRQVLVVLAAAYFYRSVFPKGDNVVPAPTPTPTQASSSPGHCVISCTQSGCTFSWPGGTGVPTALLQRAADLTPRERKLACSLLELGQAHVFQAWEQAPDFDLMAQLTLLDNNYPGGLQAYLSRAKTLLSQAASGANALQGYTPSIPQGHDLEVGGATFLERERRGAAEGKRIAYVLVAGGLGERLGYSGIKLELPSDSLTRKPFLQLYIEHILALDAAAAASGADGPGAELVLMVSGDTDAPTRELLRANNHFGMPSDRISIVRQEKVPSLADNEAHLAVKKDNQGVQTKPHGHGDVHTLLHTAGLAGRWATKGIRWVVFFQDTNALMFRSLPAVIGTSAAHGIAMNSVCVARKAAEAVGAIMTLDKPGAERVTVNVEYNQIAALLKDAGQGGDANDERTGFSPYPGSINQIVVEAHAYARLLRRTEGVVPEFVNPKYKKGTGRTLFKKPTRLESMMQDIAWQFGSSDTVSFTRFTGSVIFSPVKNSIDGAVDKVKSGVPPHSASSGENAVFRSNCDALHEMGATVAPPVEANFGGVPLRAYPKVVFSPAFAPTIDALRSRFPAPSRVSIGERASLIVEGGSGVTIEELNLEGVLRIDATADGARLVVRFRNGPLSNGVWSFEPLGDDEQERARLQSEENLSGKALDLRLEQLKMKAYRVRKAESDARFVDVKVPAGDWVLSEDGLAAAAH